MIVEILLSILSSGICSMTSEKVIVSKKFLKLSKSSSFSTNFTFGLKALKKYFALSEISKP